MPISINDFRAAAQQLGPDANLRLKEDGTGIATSRWERFKVGFFDLFRSRDQVAEKQRATVNAFLTATREYGPNMQDLARTHLEQQLGGLRGVPLSSRAVTSTVDHLHSRGGQHWLHNERMIRQASNFTGPPHATGMVTLTHLVNPVCDRVLSEAQERGLISPEQARTLALEYTVGMSQMGNVDFHMEGMSTAIADALREASIVEGGGGFRRLESDEVLRIGQQTAERVLLKAINGPLHNRYLQDHPFEAAFREEAEKRGLDIHLPRMEIGLVKELETFAVQDAGELLSPERMGELRQGVLNRYFDRQQEKLAEIDKLNLPDGKAKDRLTEICMGSRSRMNADWFAGLTRASQIFGDFANDFALAGTDEERRSATLRLGERLAGCMDETMRGESGADDFRQFTEMAFAIHAGRTDGGQIRGLRDYWNAPESEPIQDHIGDLMLNRDRDPVRGRNAFRAMDAIAVMTRCDDLLD